MGSSSAKVRFNVMKAISTVSAKIEKSKFVVRSKSKEYQTALERLNKYFGLKTEETWCLCALISYYFDNSGDNSNLRDMSIFFDCNTIEIMTHRNAFHTLMVKKYISNTRSVSMDVELRCVFKLSDELLDQILNDEKLHISKKESLEEDNILFVSKIADLVENRRMNDKSAWSLSMDCEDLEDSYGTYKFVKKIKSLLGNTGIETRAFFYDACNDFITGGDTSLNITLQDIYGGTERYRVARLFMEGTHPLIKLDFLEFTKKENLSEATLTLTPKSKELFLGENAVLYEKSIRGTDVLECDKIKEKKLFYSEENDRQIGRLTTSLQEKNLNEIQSRLIDRGMPSGIAVLLYGAPGTGKTETVYQIARQTGRNVFCVDISSTKSCWFGESEKMIKKVFLSYKQMCATCRKTPGKKIPILLFNEADAVFSKRKDSSFSSVAQTENAIQNIILEEIERLDGILIATTNLAENLDGAFERRFLFKIKFDNPSRNAKEKIWKDKLDWLSDDHIAFFASHYDFSGGQIDNISRKITMDEVITGLKPSFDEINELCKVELMDKEDSRKIGFGI